MSALLEIACFNLESAIIAQNAGADRIELCANYSEGGLTPDFNLIKEIKSKINIPVHVMVRPRKGNFVYSESEIYEMKAAIEVCKHGRIDGIVFGCLTKDNQIDNNGCKQIIQQAKGLTLNFHRAFDQCENLNLALKQLIDLGISRVLSSGGCARALQGVQKLSELKAESKDSITVMPGGGIRSTNLYYLMQTTHCSEFHSAAITNGFELCDSEEIFQMKSILKSNL